MGRATKDKRDIYYRRAKEEGWRARSAFKLAQVDDAFAVLAGATAAVDLCAAPGSWSQVLSRRLFLPAVARGDPTLPTIVAVDLQPMAPVEGVIQLQGDVTSPATARAVVDALGATLADVVVCDGAPDVTGLHDLDEFVQAALLTAALTVAASVLAPGGRFVAKIFRGREVGALISRLAPFFADVSIAKPRASRAASVEAFVVGRGFKRPAALPLGALWGALADAAAGAGCEVHTIDVWADGDATEEARAAAAAVPFVACGDLAGWDADSAYDLPAAPGAPGGYTPLPPSALPSAPAYAGALAAAGRPAAGSKG
jgi:tRNA (cytidine32/guanosine34-2'-O)-methyltransferase